MAAILIVDDEPNVRNVVVQLLARRGHRVVEAEDGRRGLKMAANVTFDLAITDLLMPEVDGIEFIMGLRKLRPGLPIIAISGGGLVPKELLLANADCLGAVVSLPKPFSADAFIEAVERTLTRAAEVVVRPESPGVPGGEIDGGPHVIGQRVPPMFARDERPHPTVRPAPPE